MIRVADTTGTVAEYIYNGNGQRADKLIPSQNKCTVFHYDQNGSLITESTRTGNIKSEYVYLNGQPLAKIENNNIYYYHNDHLGTPMLMTDASGSVVWDGEFLPFGESLSVTGSITNNLRFPGQYYDAETGLHQNGFRDYKPEIGGRYVEADPIGIEEGNNHLFVYSQNNPINLIDPTGRLAELCIRPLKALPFTWAVVHCYIMFDEDKSKVWAFDDKGVHKETEPTGECRPIRYPEKTCSDKDTEKDIDRKIFDRIEKSKNDPRWSLGKWRPLRHNCCHWAIGMIGQNPWYPKYRLPDRDW